jgi:capsular exopolysaccharide synthesis family protein
MSRIFEALQNIGAEKSAGAFQRPPLVSNAPPMVEAAAAPVLVQGGEPTEFVPVSLLPESRVVSLLPGYSLASEQFRLLAVRLRYMQQKSPLKRLLITSTNSEEGKSFVSLNLAVTLARKQRQRVLLIEGDLRRPGIAGQLNLQHLHGLSEFLGAKDIGSDPVVQLEEASISFIPAGEPPENPVELIQSRRLADMMNRLSARYDWIVIDSPPVLPLADTTAWSRMADGTLLIAREGRTQKNALKRGLEALHRANLLGVVLNSSSNVDHSGYYQRYGSAPDSVDVGGKQR